MNNESLKYEIIELLKQLPVYLPNNTGLQHVVRCPFCGDSVNLDHAHLSIHIDVHNITPMMYRCLRCDSSGILDDTLLEELGLDVDNVLHSDLKRYNRKSCKRANIAMNKMEKFIIPDYSKSSIILDDKLDYINDRIGTNIDISESRDLKLILDFISFLRINELYDDIKKRIGLNGIEILQDNYVGFLSTNNNSIVFRNIKPNSKYKRYYKLKIRLNNFDKRSFYSLPSSMNIMYTNDIDVHISEGIFDIMSILKNVVKQTENNLYYASCGFGYLTVLKSLIRLGINTGLNVKIYSDNDKSDYNHISYIFNRSNISPWLDTIHIHRNGFENEKDYGVTSDKIKDTYRIIR